MNLPNIFRISDHFHWLVVESHRGSFREGYLDPKLCPAGRRVSTEQGARCGGPGGVSVKCGDD
jgi:hypothetical protein